MRRANHTICEDLDLAITAIHKQVRVCSWKGRLSILSLLIDGPKEVSALAESASLDLSTASRHLKALRAESLVTCRRDGRRRIYSLSDLIRVGVQRDRVDLTIRASWGTSLILVLPTECLRRQSQRPVVGPSNLTRTDRSRPLPVEVQLNRASRGVANTLQARH